VSETAPLEEPSAEAPGSVDPAPPKPQPVERTGRFAALIAIGILVSRILGLVRQGMFSRFFGAGVAADAFNAAMKIPNFLQNLFGEGVLSASFIPVYAGLLARGEREEADRVAGAVAALLAVTTSVLVVLGMLATPLLVSTVAVGFDDARRELTIRLVRILFPGIGLLVGSAWCLGILNSHRRFLLSYLAPVAWNLVIIGALLWWGGRTSEVPFVERVAWAAVVGSAMQLLVQLPMVRRLVPELRLAFGRGNAHVRTVVRNFAPVFVGRGVVQISGYIDSSLASLVAPGAFTIFTNAQSLYLLPGSLFGMAVSAAELPAMSSLHGASDAVAAQLRDRLTRALRRVAFFVIPSAVAFLAIGDVLAAAVFRYGRFTTGDVLWVWGTLAGASIGLLPSTLGRLYASTFYALKDARTPLRFALVRVALTLALGYLAARHLPRMLGADPRWGTAALTAVSGLAGWVEYALLRGALGRVIGATRVPAGTLARLWGAAALAATAGWGIKLVVDGVPHVLAAALVGGAFGATYLAATAAAGEGESAALLGRVRHRLGRRG
jgi:putative peptidoglycan lipid II flippase